MRGRVKKEEEEEENPLITTITYLNLAFSNSHPHNRILFSSLPRHLATVAFVINPRHESFQTMANIEHAKRELFGTPPRTKEIISCINCVYP